MTRRPPTEVELRERLRGTQETLDWSDDGDWFDHDACGDAIVLEGWTEPAMRCLAWTSGRPVRKPVEHLRPAGPWL